MDSVSSRSNMVSGRRVWMTVAIPALAWMIQGALAWFIISRACPASVEPMSLATARVLIVIVTLIALAVTVAGLAKARQVGRSSQGNGERASSALAERVRFVATFGLVVCTTLALGVVMAGLPALMVKSCGETR